MALTAAAIRRAPKVLLHDHLDGGLRSETLVDLADHLGYRDLPETDPAALAAWLARSEHRGHLEL